MNIKDNNLNNIRNIGIIAHIDAGKTTTTERVLYFTGKSKKIGEVHDGEATMDFMDQEKERGITIGSACTKCEWTSINPETGKNHISIINIIDTPGHVDFTIEVERSLRVLDGAVCVLEGVSGVQPQTTTVMRQADKYKVPIIIFINKMDRLGADADVCLQTIKDKLGKKPLVLQWPMGKESEFHGLIDITRMNAITWEKDGNFTISEIPNEYKNIADKLHQELLETVSMEDDDLMNKYMNGETLTVAEIIKAIKIGTLKKSYIPVLFGSAYKNIGVQTLLDSIVDYLPNPEEKPEMIATSVATGELVKINTSFNDPTTGLIFKLVKDKYAGKLCYVRVYSGCLEQGMNLYLPSKRKTIRVGRLMVMHANDREEVKTIGAGNIGVMVGDYDFKTGDTICTSSNPILLESIDFPEPVITRALIPKTKEDSDKMADVLHIFMQEDPSFGYEVDPETKQVIIKGMGELHLEIKVDILKRTYGVNVIVEDPRVAYRETIINECDITYLHKKQSGGNGEFAGMSVKISPGEKGSGFTFVNNIVGGVIPNEYISSIKEGFEVAMQQGCLTKSPVVDIKFVLYDGRTHDVDSSSYAFKMAAMGLFREAIRTQLKSVLLEPIMSVVVYAPSEYMGDVIGDLSSKRGRIDDIADDSMNSKKIEAKVPLAEIFGYINKLRGITKGMGNFSMEFSSYEEVPENVLQEVRKQRGFLN